MSKNNFDIKRKDKISELCLLLLKSCNDEVKPNKLIEKFENCYKYINILIDIQKNYSLITKKMTSSDKIRMKNCQKLLDDFRDKNLISKVSVLESNSGNGLGVFANESIDKYELTMTIPIDKMITEHEAYASKFGEFLSSNKLTKTMPNLSLGLYLLNECWSDFSIHADYIACLPSNVNNFLYLNVENIKLLQHSQYLSEIIQQFCYFCCHYCYLFRVLTTTETIDVCWFKEAFCFEDFRWAISIIMSRNNSIPTLDGKSKMLALIPIWDMMNHKPGELTTDFDIDNQCLLFYSMCHYQTNDEIYMDYGNRSSFHHFLYSGFIPEINPFDKFNLKIGFNKQDSLYKLKQQILKNISIDCDNPNFPVDYLKGNILDWNLSSYLAVMMNKDSKFLNTIFTSVDIKKEIGAYSDTVKSDIKKFLMTRIEIGINCIKKSLDQFDASIGFQSVEMSLLIYEKKAMEEILKKLD